MSHFREHELLTSHSLINYILEDEFNDPTKSKTAHDPKHTTSSVKHGGGSVKVWACMEVFQAILSAHIQPNASELIGQCRWTMTQNILQKQSKSF